jgi:2-oxoglutarate ferredoxin oxidoreductase subunit alpha
VIVPEVNLGQMAKIIRSEYLIDAISFNKVRGLPLQVVELKSAVNKLIGDK